MANNKLIATVEEKIDDVKDYIDTMKKKNVNLNVKCTQYEALTVVLGTAAVVATATAIHAVVCARKKANYKKKIAAAYEEKYAKLEADLKAEYEAKLAALMSAEEPAAEETAEAAE